MLRRAVQRVPGGGVVLGLYRVSLFRNASYLLLRFAVDAPLGALFWVAAARSHQAQEVGIASALIGALHLVAMLATLGTHIGVVRFLPEHPARADLVNGVLTLVALSGAVLSVLFLAGLAVWSPSLAFVYREPLLLVSFVAFASFTAALTVEYAVFVALRRAGGSTLLNMVAWSGRLVLLVVLAGVGGDRALVLSWGFGTGLAMLAGAVGLSRLIPGYVPRPRLQRRTVLPMARFSLLNYLAELLSVLPVHLLPVLIVSLLAAEMGAYFRISWAVASPLFAGIPTAIQAALLAEGFNDMPRLRENVLRALRFTYLALLPCLVLVLLFGDKVLLLFGQTYAEKSAPILYILALSSIPSAVIGLYLTVSIVRVNMAPVVLVYGLVSASTLVMAVVLMPRMGVAGAAVAWTVSQAWVAAGIVLLLWSRRSLLFAPGGRA